MEEQLEFDPTTVAWVFEEADMQQLLEAIDSAVECVIDLETTGLDEHATTGGLTNGGVAARIVLAAITLPQAGDIGDPTTWVIPLSHPESPWSGKWAHTMRRIALAMVEAKVPICNHNMKFDSRWIYACTQGRSKFGGIDVSKQIVWDTRVSSHLLDENSSTKLKEVAPKRFNVSRWDDFDLTYPGAAEDVPMFDLGLYAARDTYWTWMLEQAHRHQMFLPSAIDEEVDEPMDAEEAADAKLGKLALACVMPTVKTLTAMEQRGIHVDVQWIEKEIEQYEAIRNEAGELLANRYDGYVDPDTGEMKPLPVEDASFAPTSLWFRGWTRAAVDAGDLRVAALTPNGKPQWNRDVLTRQARSGSEVAELLLVYRDAVKKLEFLRAWKAGVSSSQKIHSTYNVGTVTSGRLSSSGPNMQQVTKKLKPAFVPSEGYYFAELDYSQIELRVAAFISRCEPMLQAFARGDDLHTLLAARITGKAPEDVTKEERQAGKSANFGLLYGMGAYGFKEYAESVYDVKFTEQEAVMVHRTFFEMWQGIGEWHQAAIRTTRAKGEIVSPIGRIRRLPDIWDGNEERAKSAERQAINAPVQGFASDLMQMAASSIEGTLPGIDAVQGARLVGTVHDSILVEVPKASWKETVKECQSRMENIGDYVMKEFNVFIDVPLVAETTVGTRWGLEDVMS